MQDSDSRLKAAAGSDKVKRTKTYTLTITVKPRWWLSLVTLAVKIWHICGGTTPTKATIDWLATHGTKRVTGKGEADNGKTKEG